MVCIYSGILLGHKKEWDTAICSNVDGPRDYHTVSELRQTNVIWYHLYVESKKKRNSTNELIYKTETPHRHRRQRKQIYDYQRGKGGGRVNYECEISINILYTIDKQEGLTI